ncbi:MAG: universal stress protein [Thaumarchaeota archaeon]|nr:universal stress protein [Nitrososphaerota archaeon]
MAKKISRILVPLDGSKNSLRGLDLAIGLARQCNATITGLYVIPFYMPLTGPRVFGPYRAELLKQIYKFMNSAKVLSARNGIVFYEKIIKGDVISTDIVNYASKKKFDLMVISSRGFGPLKDLFLGGVSNAVVHKSKVPVLVVK